MSGPQTTSHSQTHARSDKKMIMCETGIVVKKSSQQEACNPAKKRKKDYGGGHGWTDARARIVCFAKRVGGR